MVDIESQIFDKIYTTVTASYPNCNVLSEQLSEHPTFPCVYVEEISNYTNRDTADSGGEKHSNVTFEINIYTDEKTGKKSKARAILKTIDTLMTGLNFSRSTSAPSFMKYATNYRYIVRYTATVSNEQVIYRR